MSPNSVCTRLDRLHGLVEPSRTHRARDLQRVPQPLGRDPHGVVTLAVFGIGQAALVLEQLVQLPQDVLLDAVASLGGLRTRRASSSRLSRTFSVARRIFRKTPPASRRSTALTTCRCNRSRSRSNCTSTWATPGKHSLALSADSVPQRNSICTSRSRASPSELVSRRIAFRQRLTCLRAKQCPNIANDARSRRVATLRPMHELDVFRRAHAVQLLGKLSWLAGGCTSRRVVDNRNP